MDNVEASVFVAYAGSSALRVEAMQEATLGLTQRGIDAKAWESLVIEGHVLITQICAEIDSRRALLADVSTLNENVLFEVGYALARNKLILLAFDETDTGAQKGWNDLALLATVGRIDYTGNGQKLAAHIAEKRLVDAAPELLERLLAGARARESNAVFAPSLPFRTTAATVLERFLERQSYLAILGAGDDLGLAPFQFYIQEIYRSSAAIFHLLGPQRVRATEHNSRASLLAGFAYGLDLPVLMVAETGYRPPLDFKDILYVYDSSANLRNHVETWLQNLPQDPAAPNKRLGRLDLKVELPIRSFGQYVAEYERNELTDYFIDTNEFREIMSDSSKVFIGRKGTGKTATMTQAVAELRKDRRNLVVPIKPSSYELSGLLEVLHRVESDSSTEYFLMNLWTYLIFSEVAIRTLSHAAEKPASFGGSASLAALQEQLTSLQIDADGDMSTRLEDVVQHISDNTELDHALSKDSISNFLRVAHISKLGVSIRAALGDYARVAVILDNLDKTWERGADYDLMSKFLLSLLSTGGRIERQFAKTSKNSPAVSLTISIFLRTDIYEVMAKSAREPDKIGALSIRWSDPELLIRVLEERYAAKRKSKVRQNPSAMWDEFFCSEVRGVPTRDYLLWRVLPRPRDIIYMANAALTTAINRRHNTVQESDVVFGEELYSKFALEALLVESEAQGFDLEEVLYEFAGLDSTIDDETLTTLLSPFGSDVDIRMWLVKTSFLGVETGNGQFLHVEGESEARRKMRVAERLAKQLERQVRFRVHPAFRNNLDVRDDDLHSTSIVDVTLVADSPPKA